MSEVQVATKETHLAETQRQEIAYARKELAQALDDMVIAIRNNHSLQRTADDLKGKGWWSAFKGTVSGSNDRDLASMIKGLSGSLETTQIAVQVILRLHSRKDHVLREFHSVLVEKIQKIQADTHTLDANQQSAVDVLCEFQEQIEDQLRHHEAVERHEIKIAGLTAKLDQLQIETEQWLQSIDNHTTSLKNASNHLAEEFDSLRQASEASRHFFIHELTTLANRVKLIEQNIADQSLLENWLKRNIVSFVGLFAAGYLLVRSYLS
jgi:hypothetical protein